MPGHGDLEFFLQFYALLATPFSLPIRRHKQRETLRYVCTSVTALMALLVYLFKLHLPVKQGTK